MAQTVYQSAAAPAAPAPATVPAAGPAPLVALELLALGLLLLLACVAWTSLALAHLGVDSGPRAAGGGALAAAVVAGVALRARRPRVRLDPVGLAVGLGCAAVMAALAFPGFTYGVSDKDPGGYVAHAVEISHSGSYRFLDPLLAAHAPVQLTSPGARFPGVWIDGSGTSIVPQFFHLWPALLSVGFDAGGYAGMFGLVPVAGVLSVLCLVAVVRRAGDALLPGSGLWAGGAAGLLLATNMLQVWQDRYPTTEVLAQALYVAALLGIVLALQSRWGPGAMVAGLFVSLSFLNRPDGFLLLLLAVGLGAALLATRRWDGRAWWGLAGLLLPLPHALLQAYDFALPYTRANSVPTLLQLSALTAACLAGALVLRTRLWRALRPLVDLVQRRRPQQVLGALIVLAAVGLLALGFLRPRLFGQDYFLYNGRRVRSYNEQVMHRLSWFVSLPGFAVMLLGLAVAMVRRWQAAVWVVVLPTLLLFPLYAYSARNSTRMLWWARRYIPTVLPGIVVLVALALGAAAVWQLRGRAWLRVPSLVLLAGLVAFFLSESLPLRGHDEWQGSVAVAKRVSALSGTARGIYVWQPVTSCCTDPTTLFATPVWLEDGQVSALLPVNPALRMSVLQDYRQRFPGSPVFVLAGGGRLPAGVDPAAVQPAARITATLAMWDESDLHRPARAHPVPVDLAVWRLSGT